MTHVGDVQYRGGYHDACGDIMSTVEVFSNKGVILCTLGDIMMHVGDYNAFILVSKPRARNSPDRSTTNK